MIGYALTFVFSVGLMYGLKLLPKNIHKATQTVFVDILWFAGGLIVGVLMK